MLRIFASLKTTLALAAALVALSTWGSFAIQARPEDYETIEAGILLDWLRTGGLTKPGACWWILGMILITGILCANTLVCVTVRLSRSLRHRALTLRSASAHLAHLGFLLVLAAHLVGSVAGFRSDDHRSFAGGRISVPARPSWVVDVGRVAVSYAPQGYPTSLSAELSVRGGAQVIAAGATKVNHPLMVQGVAMYLKNAEQTLRGWGVQIQGSPPTAAEMGKPVSWDDGTLLLSDWTRTAQGLALHVVWTPRGGNPRQGWVQPTPGATLPLPDGPTLTWGEIAVDTLGTFDVRYDPGAPLALAGGILLSVSLLPLLWPRRGTARPTEPASPVS